MLREIANPKQQPASLAPKARYTHKMSIARTADWFKVCEPPWGASRDASPASSRLELVESDCVREANFRTPGREESFYPSECSDLDRISYDIRKTVRIEEDGTLHGGYATLASSVDGQSRSDKLVAASSQAQFQSKAAPRKRSR
jgi:hypothetical protein